MFTHIALGLEHIHSHCLIHRDIKPDNILFQEQDGAICFKLADFGFSNTNDQAYTQCGSPLYMAPEVCLGERQTSKVDIYSFGVLTFEVLGGLQGPIAAPENSKQLPREGFQSIILGKVADYRRGDPHAEFLRQMISKNGNLRPTAFQCLEFINAVTGQSGNAPQAETSPKPKAGLDGRRPPSNLTSKRKNNFDRGRPPSTVPKQAIRYHPYGIANLGTKEQPPLGRYRQHYLQPPVALAQKRPSDPVADALSRADKGLRIHQKRNAQRLFDPSIIPTTEIGPKGVVQAPTIMKQEPAITTNTIEDDLKGADRIPSALGHQLTHDGRVSKSRKSKEAEGMSPMPGSWIE